MFVDSECSFATMRDVFLHSFNLDWVKKIIFFYYYFFNAIFFSANAANKTQILSLKNLKGSILQQSISNVTPHVFK